MKRAALLTGLALAASGCIQSGLPASPAIVLSPAVSTPMPPPPETFRAAFDFNRMTPNAGGRAAIENAARFATQAPTAAIRLIGLADAAGSRGANQRLSQRRAESVRGALIAAGIAPDRITVEAYGKDRLRVQTPDGVQNAANREVVIIVSLP